MKGKEYKDAEWKCKSCCHRRICPLLALARKLHKGELSITSKFFCADFLAVVEEQEAK